jgi:hypothetical protein
MKKQEYMELLQLSFYDEVSDDDRRRMEEYRKKHPAIEREYRDVKKFHEFLSRRRSERNIDDLLTDARRELRSAVRKQRSSYTSWNSPVEYIRELFVPKFAIGSAVILLIGILIGYWYFTPAEKQFSVIPQPVSDDQDREGSSRIENVRFIETDLRNGMVEFDCEAVAPLRMKGRIDDPEIQRILTHALLNESNAGIRLTSVNALGSRIDGHSVLDPIVKSSLITSMKGDENPGVRKEALRVLVQSGFDTDIRDALLFVLANDKNTGMRVAAVNAMEMARLDGKKFDRQTADKLKESVDNESNNYIRNRAATFIKEIYQ